MSSQANQDPFSESEEFFQNLYHQNPTQNQSQPTFIDLADQYSMARSDEILDPEPISVYVQSESKGQNCPCVLDENPNQNPSDGQLDESYRNQVAVSSNQVKVPNGICITISDDDDDNNEVNDDGRTHSLPHSKYGPYICPNCGDVFPTSQLFAAHVSSAHYKYETTAERKKRLAAKYKKKGLQVVQSRDGLTLVPDLSIKTQQGKRKKAKRAVKTEGDEIQKQGEDIYGTAAGESFLVDVWIEEDYR